VKDATGKFKLVDCQRARVGLTRTGGVVLSAERGLLLGIYLLRLAIAAYGKREPLGEGARAWGSREGLNHEGAVDIVGGFGSVVIHSSSPIVTQMVEAETVLGGIDNGEKFLFEEDELGGFDFAFEDGILHALAVVFASFGYLSESLFAAGGGGGDVVGYEDIHFFTVNSEQGTVSRESGVITVHY